MLCWFDSFFLCGATFSRQQAHCSLHRHQLPHSHQVVSRSRKDKDPVHECGAAMAQLAQQADRLQPAEDLLNPFALLLTNLIAGMTRGASVDGRLAISVVLGHVWRHLPLAQFLHEVMGVVVFAPPSVTLPAPLISSAKAAPASRSAVPVAAVTLAETAQPLRFS